MGRHRTFHSENRSFCAHVVVVHFQNRQEILKMLSEALYPLKPAARTSNRLFSVVRDSVPQWTAAFDYISPFISRFLLFTLRWQPIGKKAANSFQG